MEKTKLLFLDIDSVLNTSKYSEDIYDGESSTNGVLVENAVPLCRENVDALKFIVDNVENLGIIWSTDWRLYDKELYEKWKNPRLWLEKQEWFKPHLVGNTPKKLSSTRPEEIRMWFGDNRYSMKNFQRTWYDGPKPISISNFAVVDDYDSNAMHDWFRKHFFKTTWENGLTLDIAKDVVKLLNSEYDGDITWLKL